MTVITAFVLAVLLHELGHITAARIMKIPLISFSLRYAGLSMQFDFSRASFSAEAFVHLGGSLFGFLSAFISALFPYRFCLIYAGVSFVFAAVNLLPLSSFDGAGVISSLLSAVFLPDTVWKITRLLSLLTLVILWGAVLWIELRIGANIGLIAFICAVMVRSFCKPGM